MKDHEVTAYARGLRHCGPSAIEVLRQRIAALEAEKAARDRIIYECAQAAGAFVSPECSDEFRAMLPAQIRGRIDRLENACEIFEKNSAACAEEFERRLAAERERDALRAEKAAREAQEPVAWAWDDAAGWMQVHNDSARPEWITDEIADDLKMRPLYAAPPAPREPTDEECAQLAVELLPIGEELTDVGIGRAIWRAVRKVLT